MLVEVAGKKASEEYDEVGHSEDADEVLDEHLVGIVSDYKAKRSTAVKLVQQVTPPAVVAAPTYGASTYAPSSARKLLTEISRSQLPVPFGNLSMSHAPGPFVSGFAIASTVSAIAAGVVGKELSKFTHVESAQVALESIHLAGKQSHKQDQ